MIFLAILAFLVIFSFCACVVAHDADAHIEMMHNSIINSNKEKINGIAYRHRTHCWLTYR